MQASSVLISSAVRDPDNKKARPKPQARERARRPPCVAEAHRRLRQRPPCAALARVEPARVERRAVAPSSAVEPPSSDRAPGRRAIRPSGAERRAAVERRAIECRAVEPRPCGRSAVEPVEPSKPSSIKPVARRAVEPSSVEPSKPSSVVVFIQSPLDTSPLAASILDGHCRAARNRDASPQPSHGPPPALADAGSSVAQHSVALGATQPCPSRTAHIQRIFRNLNV